MTKHRGLPHEIYGLESYSFYAIPGYKEALLKRMQSPGPRQIKEILAEIDLLKEEVARVTETLVAKITEHGQTVIRELEDLKAAAEADIREGEEEMRAAIYLLGPQLRSPIAKALWEASGQKPVLMTCRTNIQDWIKACDALIFSAVINMQVELTDYRPKFAVSHISQLRSSQKVFVYYSSKDMLSYECQANLSKKPLFQNPVDLTPTAKRGPIQLKDGEYYIGDWNPANEMHGIGQWLSASGEVYEGQWKCGLRQGQGNEVSSIGEVYEGSWIQNMKSGFGSMKYNCGSEYIGNFSRGRKEQFGRIHYGDSSAVLCYIGEFLNDNLSGAGCLWWRSGAQYSGSFEKGMKKGSGVMYWPEGDIYIGNFAEDLIHGSGRYYWQEGCAYDGEWAGGKKDGTGKMTASGASYEGGWKEDKKYGEGIERNARGKQKKVSSPMLQSES